MLDVNNSEANFSLRSGFRFKFNVDGKELLFLASAWTGKESILYDGEEICRIRSYKKKTSHKLLINNVDYQITLTMDNWLKPDWHCCLYRNDRMVKCFNLYYENINFPKKLMYGIIFGFLWSLTPKSLWFICIPLICVAILKLFMGDLVCKVRLGD